jgi:hypothetical protein
MFRASFCPSSGAQDWDFFTTYGLMSCWCGRQVFRACCLALRVRYEWGCFTGFCKWYLPTTSTGHYTICCKKNISVLRSWRWSKACPKHVELILKINKTVIVASSWCSIFTLPLQYFTWTQPNAPFECITLSRNNDSTPYRRSPPILQAKDVVTLDRLPLTWIVFKG